MATAWALGLATCTLEDRTQDVEGGALPAVEAGAPAPEMERPGRPLGEDMAPPPVLLLGEAFWWGEERTRAVELNVRFVSAAARRAFLDPEAPVATVGGETWTLARILVAVDYRGGPAHARWQVAGPAEVLERYLDGLRDHPADRTPILELGMLEMEPRRCCPEGEAEEGGASPGEILGRPGSELPGR